MTTPTSPTTAPSSYSGTVIQVDAEMLLNFSQQILGMVQGIGVDVDMIFKTLGDLQIGWAGQTAAEAKDFFDRLDATMTALYGKSGDQTSEQSSVMARVAQALGMAGNNYLAAEDQIVDLFYFTGSVSDTAIWNEHNGKTSGGGGNSPITDPNFTSIAETYN